MNKTFNDPNVKYSDQGTPLAQAAEALSTIGEVTGAVDDLEEAVGELSEKVDLIPVPVAADDGKVLTATDDGAYELADVDALPVISAGDAGKVLMVNAGETGAEWAAAPDPLPAIASGDAGKVLTVNAGETAAEWATPSGGSGVIIATYTMDPQTFEFSCDMTYDEIATHITNGELVVGNIGGNFFIPRYFPQEYSLLYTISNYSFSGVPGGSRYLEMSCTQLTHQHIPEDSEIIQGQTDNVHWQVTSVV